MECREVWSAIGALCLLWVVGASILLWLVASFSEVSMFDEVKKTLDDSMRALLNSFWFVPALVSLFGPFLAIFLLMVDHTFQVKNVPLLFSGGSAEASTILSIIAGSLITVAGLTFSITIVVLQLLSSQYTPRALRSFLQDRVTQVVAGGFFAIFAYSLIVLMTVRDPAPFDPGFLPTVSITVGINLGFLGLALLLIFIHHTGQIIQVSDIAARIATQTMEAIDAPSPTWSHELHKDEVFSLIQTWHTSEKPAQLRAPLAGYIQRISITHLLQDIEFLRLQVHLLVSPGDFVTEETVIAHIWPAHAVDEAFRKTLLHCIYIERERDIAQDIRFGVRQLADIALRALSPAVNDPTTGILCIKYLQAVLERLVRRQSQPDTYYFNNRAGILKIRQPSFEEYLAVFAEIKHYTGGNQRVEIVLANALNAIHDVATRLRNEEDSDLLAAFIADFAPTGSALESQPATSDLPCTLL
ncbi:DUF2254 domain-containing protein [Ktedonobacter racemifer]|nr:DUF2254 domain-containing protein [Ktedonobacter racemifer]